MPWTLILTAVAFVLAMLAMAVGVILSNRRIKGSCGGLASMTDSQGRTICDACTDPRPDCAGEPLEEETAMSSRT